MTRRDPRRRIQCALQERDDCIFDFSFLRCSRIALCLIARSARCRSARKPPTLSSLADEKRVSSLLLSTAARDPLLMLSARCDVRHGAADVVARSARQYLGFPDPRCHERRLGDHERLLTTLTSPSRRHRP